MLASLAFVFVLCPRSFRSLLTCLCSCVFFGIVCSCVGLMCRLFRFWVFVGCVLLSTVVCIWLFDKHFESKVIAMKV